MTKLPMMFFKLAALCSAGFAALMIDEKTGVNIGTLIAVGGGLLWFGRKFQMFLDKFDSIDNFVEESREWRRNVSEEQELAKEEREQILRHQEQARQRHEQLMKQMDEIKLARELYAELIKRMDEMRKSAQPHSGHTEIIKKLTTP